MARAMELGINYFDTASMYGDGQSEMNLGRVLKELRPVLSVAEGAGVYVGTKVRLAAQEMQAIKGAVIRSVEESLKRLGRDYVDLIQLHNQVTSRRKVNEGSLSARDVLGEVVEAFQSLQAQGKVKFYGITGLGEIEALRLVIDSGALHTVQSCYNLLNPSAGAKVSPQFPAQDFGRLIDRAAQKAMGVIAIRVLAAGALSGVEERHPIAVPSVAPIGSGRDYKEDVARARAFSFLVEEGHVEGLVEASIRFALSKREVSTVLVGYSSLEQLEKAVEYTSRGPMPQEVLGRLPEVWAQFTGPG